MQKARDAERQRLRSLAHSQLTAENIEASEQAVNQRAAELEFEKLSRGGKTSQRKQRAEREQFRRFEAAHAAMLKQVEDLMDIVREISPIDPDHCDHSWPGHLDEDAQCELCLLPYAGWTQAVAA
jgi:aspartate oxidase